MRGQRQIIICLEKDFKPLLGGIEYDEEGRISGAKSVYMKWMGRMNSTLAMNPKGPVTQSTGTGELVGLVETRGN